MKNLVLIIFTFLMVFGCKPKDKTTEEEVPATTSSVSATDLTNVNNTYGFGVLAKVKGIWDGPVTSTTALGNFPQWIVDFRAIAENQISSKCELDANNDIFMSFFIAKYNNEYRVAFRNGGSFVGMKRVSYFLADSVSETATKSYYRFSEILIGKKRAFTEVIFSADSLYIKSYTNVYNTLTNPTPHMVWSAKQQDVTSSAAASTLFSFPKKTLAKDFSTVFVGKTESMYFATTGIPAGDPYPENAQPYLGQTTATYSFAPGYTPVLSNKVFLLLTTQPLFSGFTFLTSNLKYRSRIVTLPASNSSFVFNYMHPGTYYYYAYYDNDGNNTINSGDWLSTANTTFSLGAVGTTTSNTQINFTIP